jgi:arylsulfatase A-like enzyme
MRFFPCALLASVVLQLLAVVPSRAADAIVPARPPDIVVILADDMGISDLGCYGSEISTPHLDRLAAGGLRFTQFYNTARCCPTRASLLTGLYPHQAGVGHMVEDRGPQFPGYRGRLNDNCATVAELLRASPAGYRTYMAGKWHVGEKRPGWPVDRGFDRFFGLVSGGSNYWTLDAGRTMALDDKAITPAETDPATARDFFMTDAFTDYAVKFVDEHASDGTHKDKPFFLYLAYTAPHWPLHARPQDVERYRGKYLAGWDDLRDRRHRRMIETGLVKPEWPLTPRPQNVRAWERLSDAEKADRDLRMAVYSAQVDAMDRAIGRVVRRLEELGRLDNTLVLFLADNGGCAEVIDRSATPGAPPGPADSFLSYGVGWANASNTPFRLYKHHVHEGGIATPLIAHWPAGMKGAEAGGVTHEVGHVIDVPATCLDVAGAAYPETFEGRALTPIEGRSLLPVLRGGVRAADRPLFWEHEGHRAVRVGKWKLVARHNRPWELYDLDADRTEMRDLAASETGKVKELSTLYDEWAKRSNVEPWEKVRPPQPPNGARPPNAGRPSPSPSGRGGRSLARRNG